MLYSKIHEQLTRLFSQPASMNTKNNDKKDVQNHLATLYSHSK